MGSGGLVVRSQPRGRRVPDPKPDSTEEPPCKRVWCTPNPSRPNTLLLMWCGSLQAPSSSSNRGSKLRGPSQNSLRIAGKRIVNMSKHKPFQFYGKINANMGLNLYIIKIFS
ncbi:hypothetical protein AVEN_179496-1 [Araneus ventricosus]|uniref:Uncharacterized protein n=1 Tax=Araneus ventricosus TaxID=182803 RepID=A0A4Y2BFS7_ARAVE|nr:hypothetical protein AVEN_179496-1 [Araneus ventricosus]